MKKRFWTRLISAVLVTAMAFSILAMPASAASIEEILQKSSWGVALTEYENGAVWFTDGSFKVAGKEESEIAALLASVKAQKPECVREEGIPEYACIGLSKSPLSKTDSHTKVYWYSVVAAAYIFEYIDAEGKIPEIGVNGVVDVSGVDAEVTTVYPVSDIDLQKPWAVKVYDEATSITLFATKELLMDEDDVTTDEELEIALLYAQSFGMLYTGDIPAEEEEVYVGLSKEDGKIYWYTKEEATKLDEIEGSEDLSFIDENMDWETGVFTLGDTVMTPIAESEPVTPVDPDPVTPVKPNPGNSSAGVSAGGSGIAIIAAAGAAVAAATGIYFYTHPDAVQQIKDFFADLSANVQAKVQGIVSGVKGLFGGRIPDSEEEEAEPVNGYVAEVPAAA